MLIVVFVVCFFLRLYFSYFQKYEFFMTTTSFGIFVFGLIGVKPRVVGVKGSSKITKSLLKVSCCVSRLFL